MKRDPGCCSRCHRVVVEDWCKFLFLFVRLLHKSLNTGHTVPNPNSRHLLRKESRIEALEYSTVASVGCGVNENSFQIKLKQWILSTLTPIWNNFKLRTLYKCFGKVLLVDCFQKGAFLLQFIISQGFQLNGFNAGNI